MVEPEGYRPPDWGRSLKLLPTHRLNLARTPTPLEGWNPPHFPEEREYWIKRDDLTGVGLSGNKVRKLDFLLAEARLQDCDVVVTCGGIQSNHCRATALAARQAGLDAVLLLRTTEPEADPGLVGNLLLDRLVGAQILLITPEQYKQRESLLAKTAQRLREEGRRPYIIPEGGSNGRGSWGYLEAVREVAAQVASLGLVVDDIVFACGSGGTAAGLSLGVHLAGLPWRVHAVNVCDDAPYFYRQINGIFEQLGAPCRAEEVLDIIEGYVGLGYALSRQEELEFLRDVAAETSMILDPVYSGKACYGLSQELQHNPSRFQGNNILFWHTGGIFGLYDKIEQIAPLVTTPTPQRW